MARRGWTTSDTQNTRMSEPIVEAEKEHYWLHFKGFQMIIKIEDLAPKTRAGKNLVTHLAYDAP